jgi:hypothetical protein
MRPHSALILSIIALVLFGGPLGLALAGLARGRPPVAAASGPRLAWPWRLTIASTLTYVVAFNLVFFVQELFLVLPKAMTPGLHPVLFHNNHDWTGSNPVAELEQGAGALAALLVGLGAFWWLRRVRTASATLVLFAAWIGFNGLFDALLQLVAGAVLPRQDVGRAMTWLGLPQPVMWLVALVASAGMACAALWLTRPFLGLAGDRARVDTPARRTRFVFQAATLPALLGTVLVLPFRIPGAMVQVAIVPIVIAIVGIVWIQASAWRVEDFRMGPDPTAAAILIPLAALMALLVFFQLVLRPGVAF